MKIYVDIDNTICKTDGTDYKGATPIKKHIEKINKLYSEGNEIHYWTARGSVSKINFYDLKQLILNEAKNLKSVKFFDVYFDSNSEENINLGIRLEFQCFDKTLLNEDIEKEIEKLLKILQITFSCDLKK